MNMKNYHSIFLPFYRVGISLYHTAFDIFYALALVKKCSFVFHITQIQCLGHKSKYQKYGSSSINIKNYHSFSPIWQSMDIIFPQIRLYIFYGGQYQLRRANLYLLLLRLSVLVIIKQQKNCSSPIDMKNYHNVFSHYVEYGYPCPKDPLIYFNGRILVDMCSIAF